MGKKARASGSSLRARDALVIASVLVACGPRVETNDVAAPVATEVVATPVAASATVGDSTTAAPPAFPPSDAPVFESGFASWYGAALAGHKTASGAIFDPSKLTAAHRTLKLGTVVEVRRRDTGRYVRVLVNDRGPVSHRFVIDLSSEAARELGMLRMGVAPVELRLVR
jgi:rare lipoprotein A